MKKKCTVKDKEKLDKLRIEADKHGILEEFDNVYEKRGREYNKTQKSIMKKQMKLVHCLPKFK